MQARKIAIFCDGDFWHGHNWAIRGLSSLEEELQQYTEYWRNKILKNIEHDMEVTKELEKMNWKVIRFWESDIKKDVNKCVQIIQEEILKTEESYILTSDEAN